MKITVVMTTYNGERFLYEQLKSIHGQERKPDEVIICDDCSIDQSYSITKKFIRDRNLSDSWNLYRNKKNIGVNANFILAAEKAVGDLIFFCDQDDIWLPGKILEMEKYFLGNEQIKALNCAFSVIDEEGNENNSIFNRIRMGNGKLRKVGFNEQINRSIINGMSLAVRTEVYFGIIPFIKKYDLTFDLPVGMCLSGKGEYHILEKVLVKRRIHGSNVSKPGFTLGQRFKNVKNHLKGRDERIRHMKAYLSEYGDKLHTGNRENLDKAVERLVKSRKAVAERKICPLLIDVIKPNPMINKAISFLNILIVLFGDYHGITKGEME